MSAPVEQIKSRLSITDVIGSYLKLEKAGANWKARCPFHNEKTPSFFVSPARQNYHCFGCARGGDIFSFVEEIEGLDFVGALKQLALRAGVDLAPVDRQALSEKERLYEVLERATRFYVQSLEENQEAIAYLLSRGVSKESITAWRIGFAPAGWRNLYQHLRQNGFSDSLMLQAGLAIKPEKGNAREVSPYDRFRERIMFPLSDISGRVVGFSGRVFGPNPPENMGKYVNSPETPLYSKSKILYGYDKAKVEMRRADQVILVEGQLDLVLSHQAGLPYTVAVSGTALTEFHLQLLKRLTTNLVMAFDGDLAGFRAAKRGIEMALELGFEVRVAELPEGVDPADLVKEDPSKWLAATKNTKHVIDFLLEVLGRNAEPRAFAKLVQTEVYPYLAKLVNRLDQAHFIKKIAERTNLREETITADLAATKTISPERQIQKPNPAISPAVSSRLEKIAERLIGVLALSKLPVPAALGETSFPEWEKKLAPRREELLLQTEISYGKVKLEPALAELAQEFEREFWRESLAQTLAELKLAEGTPNSAQLEKLLQKCQDISARLSKLN